MVTSVPEEIGRELSSGEQVLWSGRPRQGIVLRGSDALLIPFSLLWCGFVVFWEWTVLHGPNVPVFFVPWGVPFVVVGLHLVVGRFFVDSWQRSRTFYAVTDERILIVTRLFSRKVKSLDLATLSEMSVTESPGGEGSIAFGPQHPAASMFGGLSGWPGMEAYLGPRFDLVANAKSVYSIIRTAQRA